MLCPPLPSAPRLHFHSLTRIKLQAFSVVLRSGARQTYLFRTGTSFVIHSGPPLTPNQWRDTDEIVSMLSESFPTVLDGKDETKEQDKRAELALRSTLRNMERLPFCCSLHSVWAVWYHHWGCSGWVWSQQLSQLQKVANYATISTSSAINNLSFFLLCQVTDRLISMSSWRSLDPNSCRLKREKASWAAQ